MLPCSNWHKCKPDDLPVPAHFASIGKVNQGYLVPGWNRIQHLYMMAINLDFITNLEIVPGNSDMVTWMQDDHSLSSFAER